MDGWRRSAGGLFAEFEFRWSIERTTFQTQRDVRTVKTLLSRWPNQTPTRTINAAIPIPPQGKVN